MKITLTPRNSTALLFLSFIMQETHELAHTSVGRLICGCWGQRNFNVWTLCKGCSAEQPISILATVAGPVYSFLVIWTGFYFLTKASAKLKSIGLALVISSMPLSRIITPIFGSGDEVLSLNRLWNNHTLAWIVSVVIVLSLAIPPLVKIWNLIANRRRPLWMAGLIVVPFLMTGIVVFGLLQGLLLNNGVLREYWVLGSPMLITVWLIFCVAVCIVFGRSLTTLLHPTDIRKEEEKVRMT